MVSLLLQDYYEMPFDYAYHNGKFYFSLWLLVMTIAWLIEVVIGEH
ncbi:hypothetical protein [Maribacter aestuarii]|nr:hypothetical protein [Maribacter aestuarii]